MTMYRSPVPRRQLDLHVRYAGAVMPDGVFERCVSLVSDAGLFGVAADYLKVVSPRKQLGPTLTHWVRKQGTNGRDFAYRERGAADAYRDQLRTQGTLAGISQSAWVQGTDGDLSIMACAGVKTGPTAGDELFASASGTFMENGWSEWGARLTEAMFAWLIEALQAGLEVMEGAGTWIREDDELRFALPVEYGAAGSVVRGYRTMMYLPAWAVDRLGGPDAVAADAPVQRVVMVDTGGVATLLCSTPDELTVDRLTAWREYLLPVTQLPTREGAIQFDGPHDRPYDLLEIDWPYS